MFSKVFVCIHATQVGFMTQKTWRSMEKEAKFTPAWFLWISLNSTILSNCRMLNFNSEFVTCIFLILVSHKQLNKSNNFADTVLKFNQRQSKIFDISLLMPSHLNDMKFDGNEIETNITTLHSKVSTFQVQQSSQLDMYENLKKS